jgi:hypothetical protein
MKLQQQGKADPQIAKAATKRNADIPSGSTHKLIKFVLTFSSLATLAAGQDVLTSRNDAMRSGVQPNETILTPANVSGKGGKGPRFTLLNQLGVDGQIYAQPLYVYLANVYNQNGVLQGKKNLLIVATEHDSVYCYDADNGTLYWKRSLLLPGETSSDNLGCSDLQPEIGITGTPVIDRNAGANGTIYVVSFAKDSAGNYTYRLNALDLGKGINTLGPTTINATFPGTGPGTDGQGHVVFEPTQERQRMGLAVANGNIYIGFGSICDFEPFTGWMLAYSQQSLTQVGVFNANPNGVPNAGSSGSSGAGIWQAGIAAVIDPGSGNIIFVTGNGPFDPNSSDYGDTVLRLNGIPNNGYLNVGDSFTPANQADDQNGDLDLGSGGGTLFTVGTHTLCPVSGKDGNIYILDLSQQWAQYNGVDNHYIYQELDNANSGIWGAPAYFNGSLYYGPQGGSLQKFTFNSTATLQGPASVSSTTFRYPGTVPSVSASGNTAGIVWAIEISTSGSAVLHAYDANNLSNELFKSSQKFGAAVKFAVPTIAGGKVFVGTQSSVGVFGLK